MKTLLQGEQSRSWAVGGKGGQLAARRTVFGHTAKRRERCILRPAAAGLRLARSVDGQSPRRAKNMGEAGLRPAEVEAGQGRE
jgi:hypothetical protein